MVIPSATSQRSNVNSLLSMTSPDADMDETDGAVRKCVIEGVAHLGIVRRPDPAVDRAGTSRCRAVQPTAHADTPIRGKLMS